MRMSAWIPPTLLIRGLTADRASPDLRALGSELDPDRFVFRVLPYAARSFAASIVMLPADQARAAAIAYLYCRMLDTYEDLLEDPDASVEAMRRFAARFETGEPERAAPVRRRGAANGVRPRVPAAAPALLARRSRLRRAPAAGPRADRGARSQDVGRDGLVQACLRQPGRRSARRGATRPLLPRGDREPGRVHARTRGASRGHRPGPGRRPAGLGDDPARQRQPRHRARPGEGDRLPPGPGALPRFAGTVPAAKPSSREFARSTWRWRSPGPPPTRGSSTGAGWAKRRPSAPRPS